MVGLYVGEMEVPEGAPRGLGVRWGSGVDTWGGGGWIRWGCTLEGVTWGGGGGGVVGVVRCGVDVRSWSKMLFLGTFLKFLYIGRPWMNVFVRVLQKVSHYKN